MAVDIKQIENELSQGNYDKAGVLIKQIMTENLTDTDKGAALVGLASAYMELMNTVNRAYLDRLTKINQDIARIIGIDSSIADSEKLINVRKSLQ
jgi:hypothetical protein